MDVVELRKSSHPARIAALHPETTALYYLISQARKGRVCLALERSAGPNRLNLGRGQVAEPSRSCSVAGCDRSALRKHAGKRGFCSMHYSRWLKHGDPLMVQPC